MQYLQVTAWARQIGSIGAGVECHAAFNDVPEDLSILSRLSVLQQAAETEGQEQSMWQNPKHGQLQLAKAQCRQAQAGLIAEPLPNHSILLHVQRPLEQKHTLAKSSSPCMIKQEEAVGATL